MAKPKKVKEERLEDILFACRNHLRGKADQSDKALKKLGYGGGGQ